MDKLNWGKRAYTVFLLCATTAIALPAQFHHAAQLRQHQRCFPESGPRPRYRWKFLWGYGGGREHGVRVWRVILRHLGTIFKIAPDGTLTTLYSFCAQSDCADGSQPNSR